MIKMRLFLYEILKLIKRKSFWMLLIGILCVNVLLVNVSKNGEDESGYKQYYHEKLEEELEGVSIENAILMLEEEQAFYNNAQEYKLYLDFPDLFEKTEISDTDLKRYEKYKEDQHYWNERVSMISEWKTYYEQIVSYPSYLSGIEENLEKIMDGPLWSLISEKEKEDIITQAKTYDKLASIDLDVVSYRSMEHYANSMVSKLLALVFVCATAILILKEDEENMLELLKTTPKGNRPLGISKILTFITVSFIGVIVISAADVICHSILYGNCDLQGYIQAIPSFYNSSYLLTIGQWLCVSVLYVGVGICIVGLLFMFLYHLFENKVFSFIAFFTFFFVEALLYVVISEESIFVGLTHINILQLFNGLFIGTFASYCHFLSIRISAQIALLLLLVLVGICVTALFIFFYDRRVHGRKMNMPNFTIKSTSMFLQEGNRILQSNKGIVILLLTMMVSVSMFAIRYNNYESLRNSELDVYKIYEKYEGAVNEDSKTAISIKMDTFAQTILAYENATQAYKEGKITYDDLMNEETRYNQKMYGSEIYNEINEMLQKEEQYIVYNKGFSAVFALKQVDKDATRSILMMIVMLLFISSITYKEGEEAIYRTTYNGTGKRRSSIFIHMGIGILFLFIAIELFSFLHFYTLYPMHDYNVSMNYLLSLDGQMPIEQLSQMNAGIYMIILYLIRLFAIVSIGIISICIFRLSRNRIIGLLIALACFFLPMFLYYNGFTFMSYVSIFDLVMGNLYLQRTFSFVKLLMIFVCDVICIKATFKSFKS